MSKIIYDKHCRQHAPAAQAKRMLNKIEKQFSDFQEMFYCGIQLTGVNDIDRHELKYQVEKHLKELKSKIEKELLKNEKLIGGESNEKYEEGFYLLPLKKEFQIIEALNEIHSYIWSNYPELEAKKDVFQFSNATAHPEEKRKEYQKHYERNPIIGFNKTFFIIYPNGKKREIFPLTADVNDLKEATEIETVYE